MDIIEFKILNTAIERLLNKEMSELGITYTQATVIGYLNLNKNVEICQKDLELNLGVTHPTMSSILSRLEEKNFIKTEPLSSDKRYKKISLTKKSNEIINHIDTKIKYISNKLFKNLNSEEIDFLSSIIKKIILNSK